MKAVSHIISFLIVFLIATFSLFAQANSSISSIISIKGIVVDKITWEPLVGANILVNGTNLGTSSDMNGSFQLNIPATDKITFTVSIIGYKSETIDIKDLQNVTEPLEIRLTQGLIEMGTVVVTGTNTVHLYENTPVKTEIVSKKIIEQQGAYNLAQSLGLQTGVMVENDCNNCNFMQVRLLGFDGKYSQILLNGDPVVSSLGAVYGLEHYPSEMIEQIEIVKGGGSALYGAGAVAGTINMMTRRPAFNSTKINYTGSSAGGSFDQLVGAFAEIVNNENTAGLFLFGSLRKRNPYDHNADGFTELGQLSNETIGFNSYFVPFSNSEIEASFFGLFEDRRGGNDLDKPPHEADIAEYVEHTNYGGKLKWKHKLNSEFQYTANYAFSILKRDSYYGGLSEDTPEARLEALNYYGYAENPVHIAGLSADYFISDHILTAGMQYSYENILDQSVSNSAYYVNDTYKTTGLFIQDELSFGEMQQFKLIAGVRFDKNSVLENWIVSPRINAMYQMFESLKFRAAYTTGFKPPQIFSEDLHICGLEGTQRVIRNADGLTEERSSTISAGLEFLDFVGDIPLLFGLTAFYTNLSDAYVEEFISADGNIEYWERINSSGANAKGIEFDLGIKPILGLEFRAGYTIKENKYEENLPDFNTDQFLRTPDQFGYLRTSYEMGLGFSAFASLKYTGSMYVPHEIAVEGEEDPLLLLKKSDSFLELDLAMTKDFQLGDLTSAFTLGIKNLTNAYQKDLDYGATRDPAYVYGPSQPRTVYLAFNLKI
jgi:outer membrane receptor for ferrienterochelin and colicins